MYFKKFTPSPLFARFIDCYFTMNMNLIETSIQDLVIPDGTFGLIFIESDDALGRSLSTSTSSLPLKHASIFGQKTHAVNYELNSVNSKVFGLKIKPSGISLFTKDIRVLQNTFANIDTLNDAELLDVEYRILEAREVTHKIRLIEQYMYKKLSSLEFNTNFELMELIVNYIHNRKGNLRLDQLATHFGLNYKKMERLFIKYLGLSPKQYLRIIRFNASISSSMTYTSENLTQMAYRNGFFDQSHFIKEFKQFTSLTPKQFFSKDRSLSEGEYLNIINDRW
ncbi:helix-turn-helix domain-containing protein [uncultured Psychroserpens sp.]|uniref:helix-turn-helix domain-containing protein n=1 Tax=uncultured Psychroserpens sp. TaxID=255436 RepID=UPI00344F94EC